MPDAVVTALDLVATNPWILLAVAACFVVLQAVVVRRRTARSRRPHDDRAAQRPATPTPRYATGGRRGSGPDSP